MKKTAIILGGIVVVAGSMVAYRTVRPVSDAMPQTANMPTSATVVRDEQCLGQNQRASYVLHKSPNDEDTATIEVFDIRANATATSRVIPIVSASHYHPVETHKCRAYALVGRGFDEKTSKPTPEYFRAVSSFSYDTQYKTEIVRLTRPNSQSNDGDGFDVLYNFDFRVSPDERFIALIRGYGGRDDYAVVVKPLVATATDALVLPFDEIAAKHPFVAESYIALLDWSRDGRYLWVELFEQAYMDGWIRIDSRDWSYEVYEAPEGILGGYPLNIQTGWVPLIPGAYWSGFAEDHDAVEAERAEAGETASLYLYNIFTTERRLVEHSSAPMWRGLHGVWVDDAILKYDMPDGTTKTYRVQ